MIEFHRTPGGRIKIDYNNLTYEDSVENLAVDSSGLYVDSIAAEYQQWSEGKICIIENGNQQPAPQQYQSYVSDVLDNLQTIVDAKIDREALANPEVQLSLNPTTIVADGAGTTTLTIQLVSGLKHDNTRENIAQAGVNITVLITEPGGTQSFDYVTNANGQATDNYDAVATGSYQFQATTHTSNVVELIAT
jgi:hypothetical protein